MQVKLRKHILSNYATVGTAFLATSSKEPALYHSTTSSQKHLDATTIKFGGPTDLTHAIEESDPDEFVAIGPTMETRKIETSDPDEMKMGPTMTTFAVESSDEDEFLLM